MSKQIPESTMTEKKTVKLNSGVFLLVEVKEGNPTLEVINFDETTSWLRWFLPDWSDNGNINLPAGQWEIIGKGNEITEEVWEQIFKEDGLNKICEHDGGGYVTESDFTSMAIAWMKFKGMSLETTLILKLKNNA